MHKTIKFGLWMLVLAPAIFVFFAIQHSAITAPFWDHCELGRLLVKIHYQGLNISDFWAAHNQARPLLFRALLVVNGIVTDWDIRSEYVYLYVAMYSGFLVLAYGLWRAAGRCTSIWFLCLLVLMSVLAFSPVGHNNHWYSMQVLYQLTNTFLVTAFVIICLAPDKWNHNILSALACWAASYGTANGLPGFVCCAVVAQVASASPRRINRFVVFWIANICLLLALYLPGLPTSDGPRHPSPIEMLWFVAVFLGLPVAGLIRYPYISMFDPPEASVVWRVLIGIAVCVFATCLAWVLRRSFHRRSVNSLLFLVFALYALASGVLTAWGRAAFPPLGITWANSSRYSMYAVYLAYGIVFLLAIVPKELQARFANGGRTWKAVNGIAAVAFIAVLLLAARSYADSLPVYHEAHEFNRKLEAAFASDHDNDVGLIYPVKEVAAQLKRDLRALRLGPYRYAREEADPSLTKLSRNRLEDQFGINGIRSDPQLGVILFAHPRSRYYLPVDRRIRSVRAMFGMADTAMHAIPGTDGVEFRLLLEQRGSPPAVIWSRYLNPVSVESDRGRQKLEVSIQPADGSRLIFETNPGLTSTADWAYWKEISLEN